jgi:hypothetical protein
MAKAENQAGAQGLAGLYNTNVSGQLNAMKTQGQDISSAAAMTQSPFADIANVMSLIPKPPQNQG